MAGNKPGLMRQMWTNFKKSFVILRTKDKFIGADEFGNQYFEREADQVHDLKRQRKVVSQDPDPTVVPKVPVEWMTWLQGRRNEPPSPEEIEKNRFELLKTLARASKLEERDLDGKEELGPVRQIAEKKKFPMYPDLEKTPGEER